MKILIIGSTGMLGNTMMRVLSEQRNLKIFGTARSQKAKNYFQSKIADCLIYPVNVNENKTLKDLFSRCNPDIVINCVGLVKQSSHSSDPLSMISLNSLLPWRLAELCEKNSSRLIQISTDCVFSGLKGLYCESDIPDAKDIYGRSKLLGELSYPHTTTIRTSIIGHEIVSRHGLLEWFLSQEGQCYGYTNAIFSGLPTVVLSQIIRDELIPRQDLSGVYHVAADPISKYNLLKLIGLVYKKKIKIIPDNKIVVNRSLNAERFLGVTNYVVPPWTELVNTMHAFK